MPFLSSLKCVFMRILHFYFTLLWFLKQRLPGNVRSAKQIRRTMWHVSCDVSQAGSGRNKIRRRVFVNGLKMIWTPVMSWTVQSTKRGCNKMNNCTISCYVQTINMIIPPSSAHTHTSTQTFCSNYHLNLAFLTIFRCYIKSRIAGELVFIY